MNQKAIDLIKKYEGLKLVAYKCPAGVWTVGYGATGKGIDEHTVWTSDMAEKDIVDRLEKIKKDVEDITHYKMNENQLSAIVSFVYNVGVGAYHDSTLLKFLNQGDVQEAADQFMRWNKAGGKTLKGLTNRRSAERDLFLKPIVEPLAYNDPKTELDKIK